MPVNTPAERLETFSRRLSEAKIDSAVVSDPRHIHYFTGFMTSKPRINSILGVDPSGEGSVLLVGRSEEAPARRAFSGRVEVYQDYDIQKSMITYPDAFSRLVGGALKGGGGTGRTVGIEEWHLPQAFLSALAGKKVGISRTILSMRRRKGADEVADHVEAAKRLDRAYKVAAGYPRAGRTELQLFRRVNASYFEREGQPETWRHSDVLGDFVSGERTLEIGGPPTERRMRRGDTLIMDLQNLYNGHWADTARTMLVGLARPTARQERIFETLLRAKREAEGVLRPGTKGGEVYGVVARTITDAGFDPLPHHAGHGIGLDSQEAPFFIPGSQDVIQEGDVCAVEPGIYDREAGGMRIEDNYAITEKGFEKVSRFPISLA